MIVRYGSRRSVMLEDFKRALARVQTDYGFYIQCQSDPSVALVDYDLTTDERTTLSDPQKLAALLERGIGGEPLRISIKVTISGKHDWVNRATAEDASIQDDADRNATVIAEIKAIKQARTGDERHQAVLRLMEQIG
jgi:hypothetical protein